MHSQNHFQSFRGGLRLALALAFGLGLAVLFLSQAGAQPIGKVLGEGAQADHPAPVSQDGGEAGDPDRVPDPVWISLVESLSQPPGESPAGMALDVNLRSFAIYGRMPSLAAVSLTVERAGVQIAAAEALPVPNAGSFIYTAYPEWDYSVCYVSFYEGCEFLAGDILLASQVGNAISMTIPALTALAYPDAELISGASQPGAALMIYGISAAQPPVVFTQTITAGSDGSYLADLSGIYDLRPADRGYVVLETDASRHTYRPFVAPQLIVEAGGTTILGVAAPDSVGVVTVTSSSGAVIWNGFFYTDGKGEFSNLPYQNPYLQYPDPLQPGQHVLARVGDQIFSTTVQILTVSADLQQGQVVGQAQPGKEVQIKILLGPLTREEYLWFGQVSEQELVTASSSGAFNLNLELEAADYGFALAFAPDENQTFARFVIPYLHVVLGSVDRNFNEGPILLGQTNAFDDDITVSAVGSSGYLKDRYLLTSYPNGYFFDYHAGAYYGLVLESGDTISLTSSTGVQLASQTLPVLTIMADEQTDLVSGLAPPGSRLSLEATGGDPYGYYPKVDEGGSEFARLIVTATVEGTYQADFSGLIDLTPMTWLTVSMLTPQGHSIQRNYLVEPACPGTVTRLQVGGNRLGLWICKDFQLVLRDPDGYIKYEHQFHYSDSMAWDIALDDDQGQPILLQPGDRLLLIGNNRTFQITVPVLDANLTAGTNHIHGHAPPDSGLTFYFSDFYHFTSFTTTSDHQGGFQVSVPEIAQFDPGARVYFRFSQPYPEIYAFSVLPGFDARLYQDLGGWLSPFEPYTLLWTEAQSGTQQVFTGTANEFGDFSIDPYLSGGRVVVPRPDDQLQMITSNAQFELTLPHLTAQVDFASGRVSGSAPPGARLRVGIGTESVSQETLEITASLTGVYAADFPDLSGTPGLKGEVSLLDIAGNQVRVAFGLPSWSVVLEEKCVGGFASAIGLPASLTRQPAGGGLPESTPVTGFTGAGNFNACLSNPIHSHDGLTLTGPYGSMQFLVPTFTVQYNGIRKVVEGRAPPGTELIISVDSISGYFLERHTQAGSDGRYGLDISDLHLSARSKGDVSYTDGNGNVLRVDFPQAVFTFMPLMVLSGP